MTRFRDEAKMPINSHHITLAMSCIIEEQTTPDITNLVTVYPELFACLPLVIIPPQMFNQTCTCLAATWAVFSFLIRTLLCPTHTVATLGGRHALTHVATHHWHTSICQPISYITLSTACLGGHCRYYCSYSCITLGTACGGGDHCRYYCSYSCITFGTACMGEGGHCGYYCSYSCITLGTACMGEGGHCGY